MTFRSRATRFLNAIHGTPAAVGFLLGAALLASAGCKKEDDQPADDLAKPLAVVDRDTVKVGDVVAYMRAAELDQTIEGRDEAIEDLIAVAVVKRAARNEKLTPEQEQMKGEWEDQLLMGTFRDSVMRKTAALPDSAIEAFYRDQVSDEIKARHVLIAVSPEATAEDKAAARKKAEEALAKARGGADFEKLSREYSEPKTAASGGDLGWFTKGQMVPAFERAAFGLKPGEVSGVVETRFGYHVIKAEDRRKKSLEEMRSGIEGQLRLPLMREAEERYVERMLSESNLQLYEANVDTLVALFAADSVEAPAAPRADLPIATWDDDRLTIRDIFELYEALPPENRAAAKALDRDKMLEALTPLVRNRMLLARAKAADLKLDPERTKQLELRLEELVVTGMMRNEVKEDAVVTDSAARAAFRADSAEKYAGRSWEQAEREVRQAVLQEQMAEVNSQAGQRRIVHAIADKHEGEAEVKRFEDNYELVLEELAPDTSAAGEVAADSGEAGQEPAAAAPAGGAGEREAGGAEGAPPSESPAPE